MCLFCVDLWKVYVKFEILIDVSTIHKSKFNLSIQETQEVNTLIEEYVAKLYWLEINT